jgi:hypothetical protein
MEELGRRTVQIDLRPASNPLEDFMRRGTAHLTFQETLDIVRQAQSGALGALHKLSVQPFWDVANLDHLRHVSSMSHVIHIFKR